jgi:hypothetical protein
MVLGAVAPLQMTGHCSSSMAAGAAGAATGPHRQMLLTGQAMAAGAATLAVGPLQGLVAGGQMGGWTGALQLP